MKLTNLLTNNLIIGVSNDQKNYQRVQEPQKEIQRLQKFKEMPEICEASNQGSATQTILTPELKEEIKATFDRLIDKMIEEITNEIDYKPYRDYDRLLRDAEDRAKEEIERDFEEYNNWIGEDDFADEAGYERGKKEIINFIKEL